MKKLAFSMAVFAALGLSGCSIFYNVQYEDNTKEINEYGMLGCAIHRMSPNAGPYGLIPFMRDVRVKGLDTSSFLAPPEDKAKTQQQP
ncbi:hypothetical protein LLG95_14610 [bacterium]|nr:hypothetical protein [bacterium]